MVLVRTVLQLALVRLTRQQVDVPMSVLTTNAVLILTVALRVRQTGRAMDPWLVPIEFLALARSIFCVDVERLLEALVRLVMVAEQVLKLFLLHLLLVGNRL